MNLNDIFKDTKIQRAGKLSELGVGFRDIQRGIKDGVLVRPVMSVEDGPVTGLIALAEAEHDPDFDDCVVMLATNGIICLQSAAMRLHLSTSIRNSIDVYLPHDKFFRMSKALNVTPHRSRNEATLTVGVSRHATSLGIDIRMTSPARTVVDLIRNRPNSEDDYRHGLYAIGTYFENGGNMSELIDIASHFGKQAADMIEIAASVAKESHNRMVGA